MAGNALLSLNQIPNLSLSSSRPSAAPGAVQEAPGADPSLVLAQIEQVSQLSALVDAQLDYHRQAVQILDELADKLKRR